MARASAMVGLGLLLALAATIAPLPPPADVPGASLTVRVPALVQTIVLALLALSALLLLFLQRPRRPVEGAVPLRARRRPATWTAFVSLIPFLALLAIAWYYVAHHGPGEDTHGIERAITAIVGLMDLLAFARKPPTSITLVDATVAALVLAFALALFALLLLVTFAARLEAWWAARAVRDTTRPPDEPIVTLGDPRLESDPRRAVILAWAQVERALAVARAPRAPWQTPAELTRAALARLPLPEGPVRRLTGLFEVARFSNRPLSAEARAAACACLDEITAALAEYTARAH